MTFQPKSIMIKTVRLILVYPSYLKYEITSERKPTMKSLKQLKRWVILIACLIIGRVALDLNPIAPPPSQSPSHSQSEQTLQQDAYYYERDDVAAYLNTYRTLPPNYITKKEADAMQWTTDDPIYVIGGDRFGNREGLLPKKSGRQYYEADLKSGYTHHRGPERLVYSDDGLIFYTPDHYDSFEQLY